MHSSVTADRVMDLIQENETMCQSQGICLACGEDADSVEPDGRRYECDSCGEHEVYGAEEVLVMVAA